jgi:hypothetical protein
MDNGILGATGILYRQITRSYARGASRALRYLPGQRSKSRLAFRAFCGRRVQGTVNATKAWECKSRFGRKVHVTLLFEAVRPQDSGLEPMTGALRGTPIALRHSVLLAAQTRRKLARKHIPQSSGGGMTVRRNASE